MSKYIYVFKISCSLIAIIFTFRWKTTKSMTTRRGAGTASVMDGEGNLWVLGGHGSRGTIPNVTDVSEDLPEGYNYALADGTEVFKEATKETAQWGDGPPLPRRYVHTSIEEHCMVR